MTDLNEQIERDMRVAVAYAKTMDMMLAAIFPTVPKRIEETTEKPQQPQKEIDHD